MLSSVEQVEIETQHVFHAGMYARTILLPAGVMLIGALVKIPTLLIVNGNMDVLMADEWVQINGYGVLPGSAGRKQAFISRSQVMLTMIFPTHAKTVEEAEREFTDEHEKLMSRKSANSVVSTGE